jgi:hypothetical protein
MYKMIQPTLAKFIILAIITKLSKIHQIVQSCQLQHNHQILPTSFKYFTNTHQTCATAIVRYLFKKKLNLLIPIPELVNIFENP